jgi:nucleotide-binding universal stress UspA family protein
VEARRGDPAQQLEATAAAATALMLMVGSRGLGPWRAVLLGSVSRRVLQIARRPVMIVPATMNTNEAAA